MTLSSCYLSLMLNYFTNTIFSTWFPKLLIFIFLPLSAHARDTHEVKVHVFVNTFRADQSYWSVWNRPALSFLAIHLKYAHEEGRQEDLLEKGDYQRSLPAREGASTSFFKKKGLLLGKKRLIHDCTLQSCLDFIGECFSSFKLAPTGEVGP